MRAITDKRILLGVTGGIACYKAAALARLLAQGRAAVDVVMTRSAAEFVGATTFEALTGRTVHSELFGRDHALDHIRLAQQAGVIVVAPATADFMARMVHGRADDLLTATVLAATCPVLVVPAMNDRMWAKPATQRNVSQLRSDGVFVLDPAVGPLAAGEGEGPGRMQEPEVVVEYVARLLTPAPALKGTQVVVTAGPTKEAIDPVRFISNHSSGKMGFSLARAAWRRGAEVTLITGVMPVSLTPDIAVARVETTEQMAEAVRCALPSARVLIMAAAPADFRPAAPSAHKLPKGELPPALLLERTADILKSTAHSRPRGSVIVGFALETGDGRGRAREKLAEKNLDMIVLNDATEPGAGFGVDTNRVSLLFRGGREIEVPLLHKDDVSEVILDEVEGLLRAGE
jgi:phosphopantothenoylcysteine decarboxylase/phosphopantothenate--cysteine ligase